MGVYKMLIFAYQPCSDNTLVPEVVFYMLCFLHRYFFLSNLFTLNLHFWFYGIRVYSNILKSTLNYVPSLSEKRLKCLTLSIRWTFFLQIFVGGGVLLHS